MGAGLRRHRVVRPAAQGGRPAHAQHLLRPSRPHLLRGHRPQSARDPIRPGDAEQYPPGRGGLHDGLAVRARIDTSVTPPPAKDTQLWQFTGSHLTTYSGARGTMLGPWTTSKIIETSTGASTGTVMASPSALGNHGQDFGVWLRSLPLTYTSAFAGYADSTGPFRFVSTALTVPATAGAPCERRRGAGYPGAQRRRDPATVREHRGLARRWRGQHQLHLQRGVRQVHDQPQAR